VKPKHQDQADLFRSRLDQVLDRKPPLLVLANQIDWAVFDQKFGRLYADKGRPALPTRLMVGLHYLKHAFNKSDESVVARLLEIPYWQHFSFQRAGAAQVSAVAIRVAQAAGQCVD
jgi:IS5 family transposase